jgi:hypothetical protein
VPGDYYGNGQTVIATYRPSTAQWFIAGQAQPITFGEPNVDIPAPADYYHNGQTVIATYRPGSPGQWFIAGTAQPISYGGPNDIPVPGDYFGFGHDWLATYRPATSQWSLAGIGIFSFGWAGHEIPAPGDYLGLGHIQAAMYQPDTGQWFIGGQAQPVTFGGPGGIPAAAPYQYKLVGGGAIQVQSVSGSSVTALDFGASAATLSAGQGTNVTSVISAAPAGTWQPASSPSGTASFPRQTVQRVRPNTSAQTHLHPFPALGQFVSLRARVVSDRKAHG